MTAFNESLLPHAGSDRTAGAASVPPIVAASVFASWGEPDRAAHTAVTGTRPGRRSSRRWARSRTREPWSSHPAGRVDGAELALTEGRERLVMPADGYFSTRTLANRLRPNGVEPGLSISRTWRRSSESWRRGRASCGPRRRPTRCFASPTWPASASSRRPPACLWPPTTRSRPASFSNRFRGGHRLALLADQGGVGTCRRDPGRGRHPQRRPAREGARLARHGRGRGRPVRGLARASRLATLALRIRHQSESALESRITSRPARGWPRCFRDSSLRREPSPSSRCRTDTGRCSRSRWRARRPRRTRSWQGRD